MCLSLSMRRELLITLTPRPFPVGWGEMSVLLKARAHDCKGRDGESWMIDLTNEHNA